MLETLAGINPLAVIVAAAAYFALGGLWYSPPLFGRQWSKASGIEVDEPPNPLVYALTFVITLITTLAVAMLVEATGSNTAEDGLMLGLVAGLGIAAGVIATNTVFDNKPSRSALILINGGYHLVGILIAALIVSIWQ